MERNHSILQAVRLEAQRIKNEKKESTARLLGVRISGAALQRRKTLFGAVRFFSQRFINHCIRILRMIAEPFPRLKRLLVWMKLRLKR
jgi:hypothetical protein